MNNSFSQDADVVSREDKSGSAAKAKLVYILYLLGIVTGVAGIVGVVLAYVHKSDSPDWLQTHFEFQIRTFWIGLIFFPFIVLLSIVLIGYFIWLLWVVWLSVRCIKGMKSLDKSQAVEDPKSWLF